MIRPYVKVTQKADDPGTVVLFMKPDNIMSKAAAEYVLGRVADLLSPAVGTIGTILDLQVLFHQADRFLHDAEAAGWLRPNWDGRWVVVL